jgi:hypothetical protein
MFKIDIKVFVIGFLICSSFFFLTLYMRTGAFAAF